MSDSFWLTEQQFARLEAYLPNDTRGGRGSTIGG